MKIRNGFISNSSSTSFVIFGKIFNNDSLMKQFGFTEDEIEDIEENGLYDHISDELTYENLDDGEYVIGRTLSGNSDKICSIMEQVKKVFGNDCKLYNGINQDGEIIEFEGDEDED